ncbi:MAG: DUF5611 family protein [Methanoregula sp.]|nr:MAG: DUF5611 family protein [Methanoregula sp.]
MQEYPVKRGLNKDLIVRMTTEMKNCFGVEPTESDGTFRIRYGALKRLDVKAGDGNKTVIIDTESDMTVTDDVIIDTNKRFRKYLDAVTGFSTKERVKRAKSPGEE